MFGLSMWDSVSLCMVASGTVAALVLLLGLDAPYGKFGPDKPSRWGPCIPARWGWFVQESPSILCMLWFWMGGGGDKAHAGLTANNVLAAMFCFHYFVRAWIFPFLLADGKPVPISIVGMAFAFCATNGWLQGSFLFTAPGSLPSAAADDAAWLASGRTRLGIAMFFVGWAANQHADYILRHLRDKPSGTTVAAAAETTAREDAGAKARKDGSESAASPSSRYRIPHGGLFEYVSAANYSAEIVEWSGFALASGPSVPALAFLAFTVMNLAPRALSTHRWYRQQFGEAYPKQRKAIIPFIL